MVERKTLSSFEVEKILAKHFGFDEATLIKERQDCAKEFKYSNVIEFIFNFRNADEKRFCPWCGKLQEKR